MACSFANEHRPREVDLRAKERFGMAPYRLQNAKTGHAIPANSIVLNMSYSPPTVELSVFCDGELT